MCLPSRVQVWARAAILNFFLILLGVVQLAITFIKKDALTSTATHSDAEEAFTRLGGNERKNGVGSVQAPFPGMTLGPARESIFHWHLSDDESGLPAVGEGNWDLILDARSPAEYKEDHIPGSISTPVLDNSERAVVGTKYKSDKFTARRIGAALISESIAKLLKSSLLANLDSSAKILVVCWRGGERSHSLATILARVGYKVGVLKGGYQAYRRRVRRFIERLKYFKYVVISGPTGSGKTLFLKQIENLGGQVIDLEGEAGHKGSILGDSLTVAQPSQKVFEGRLAKLAEKLDPKRPVFIEDEGSRIGLRHLPNELWNTKKYAPRCNIDVPMNVRIKNIREDYDYFEKKGNFSALSRRLEGLKKRAGAENVKKYIQLAQQENWDDLVELLLKTHYDKAYAKAVLKAKPKEEKKGEGTGDVVMTVPISSEIEYKTAALTVLRRFDPSVALPK